MCRRRPRGRKAGAVEAVRTRVFHSSWSAEADHPRFVFLFLSCRPDRRKKLVDGRPPPTMTGERAMCADGAGKEAGLFGGGADGDGLAQAFGFHPAALGRREPSFQTLEALVQAILHLVHVLTQPDDESERQHGEDDRHEDENGEFFRHAAIVPQAWQGVNLDGCRR